jgi:hypothetical protein
VALDIQALGGSGTHSLRKVNVNLDEDYIYYPNKDQNTAFPSDITDDSAWVYRQTTGSINGITAGETYFLNSDGFSVGFSNEPGGSNINLINYTAGSVTFDFPYLLNNVFNINTVKYKDQQAVRYLTSGDPISGLTSGNIYFVKNLLTGSGGTSLYQFESHTFTTAGVTGQFGPTLNQLRASYSDTTWANIYLNQGTFQGYQDWTVPETGVYEFVVKGAPGRQGNALGGGGAIVKGRVVLQQGEIITVSVGQRGELPTNNTAWPASSGGTFVVRKNGNIPLFVAGGGSSSSNVTNGFSAVTNSTFGGTSQRGFIGGANGNGAGGISAGGGGGGFFSAGGNSSVGGGGGGFNNGLVGGFRGGTSSANGGFGGGGGSDGQSWGGPGGAGGYGGGATNDAVASQSGGGGGSFIFESASNVGTSNGLYNGANTLLGNSIENLNEFNTGAVEGSVAVELVERSVFGFTLHESGNDARDDENVVEVEPAGNAFHALVPITYDTVGETINSTRPHGLFAGESLSYFFTGTAASPLSTTTVYYVDLIDDFSYRLSITPDPFYTTLNLLTPSSATLEGFGKVIVNVATNQITIPNHGFLVDQPVRYSNGGGTNIFPLQNNITYYVKEVVDENRITLSQALQGPVVDLQTPGTGTRHSFILNILNELEDTIYLPSHGYSSGQTVRYQKSSDLVISSISTSGTSRFITTTENHNLTTGNRVTFDNFARPTINTPELSVTQISSSGQTRTLTTGATHNLFVGSFIEVFGFTGVNSSRYNGVYVVNGTPTTNSLTYVAVESFNQSTINTPDPQSKLRRRSDYEYVENTRILDIISISSSGTTRTITTRTPHYFSAGYPVFINGISGSRGDIINDIGEYFNGAYVISSIPSLNTFQYVGYHEKSNVTLDNNIATIPTTTVENATVYREVFVDTISSPTVFRYQMPQSSFSTGAETASGRTSRIGIRINNRNLTNTTVGQFAFDNAHGLIAGDKFTVTSISGANQNVFNGVYRVSEVVSASNIRFLANVNSTKIERRALVSNTAITINTTQPHNLQNGNFIYLEGNSDTSGDFWDNKVNIVGVSSEGTTRTIYTDNPHYLAGGERFRVLSVSNNPSAFLGEWIVSAVQSATQFTFIALTSVSVPIDFTATGRIQKAYSISSVPIFSISSRFKNGTVADITTSVNHGLITGDRVRVYNIGGANPELFIGEFTITGVPALNRFTYTTVDSTTIVNAGVGGTVLAPNQIRYGIPTYTRGIARRELVSHTIALFTTTLDHYFSVGTTVTISGISGNNAGIFNGTFVIASVPTARSFTVTRPPLANVTTFTVANRSRSVNVCDVTFNTTHNLQVGNQITISNITGTFPEVFNGTHVITAIPATNRVQFFSSTSGTIDAAAVTGDIQVQTVQDSTATGTITLNTIPAQVPSTGDVVLREVAGLGVVGEFISDTKIPGLQNQKIYFIQRIDANTVRLSNNKTLTDFVDISGVGVGTHSVVTFSVDFENDTITIPNHGFTLGELVEYDSAGQQEINGLSSSTPYYVIPIDGNTFKLAASSSDAENGFAIDLLANPAPVGRHKLKSLIKTPDGTYTISRVVDANSFEVLAAGSVPEVVKVFSPRASVDVSQNHIKIPSHGFVTGTEVIYDDDGETPIGGLISGDSYYTIVINRDYIQLASSVSNAFISVPVVLTSFGAGLSHSLTTFQLSGNITGTGTLSTTEGSVLVSGSGTAFSKILKVGDPLRIFPPDIENPSFFASTDVNISTEEIVLASHPFETGDSVIFNPGSGGPRRGVYQLTSSATTRTVRTREAHGYITGNIVTISELSSNNKEDFQGTFTITSTPDIFTFTYTAATSLTLTNEVQTSGIAQTTGPGGTAPVPLVSGFFYFINSIPNTSIFTVTNRNRTDNILDFTTSVNHNLRAGNTFTVSEITGVNPEVFNGTFIVAQVPAANRIQALATVTGVNIGAATVTGILTPQSSNTVTLHNTRPDSINGTNPIDLSSQGTGFALKLSEITPSSPIIREISAIGSDTQITVTRPYNTTFQGISYSYPTFIYVRPQGFSLHRPFDGGVEMSTGFGVWFGSIIRQTRKYFRYQSGKGLQTSAGINFKPSIDIESMVRVGQSQTITVRTRRPHGLVNGLVVKIDEALDSFGVPSPIYNGEFQVVVIDEFNFTIIAENNIVENKAFGYPRLHVTLWSNGALRSGMFDDQNGMFFEFDGEKLYAVRRSSTQQIAGTCAALRGSQFVFGTNTNFGAQLKPGDYIVMRGQSYKVASVDSDTRISIKPEYKGASGTEKEFNPGNGTDGVVKTSTNRFNILSHGFTQNLPVVYNSIDGKPIGGLRNGVTYYIDVVDSNNFRLKPSPDTNTIVQISDSGTLSPHSFTPAKTGIIATLTEDVRIPQDNWSIDPCDGTGPTGYNLDLSKIQMVYIDYSWYGAGKIRFGFKTLEGEVQYVHEFVHNNRLYESYFRSGNLPARYEVVTFENPTYIPALFHWGTSVIMDGQFDDDRAYLFTKSSPSLSIGGTTAKSFGSTAINFNSDIINIPSHGFATGEAVQFIGIGSNGLPQVNTQNPQIRIVSGGNQDANLINEKIYFLRVVDPNNLVLFPNENSSLVAPTGITSRSKSAWRVTITTVANHGYNVGDFVWVYIPPADTNSVAFTGVHRVITVPSATQFTYDFFVGARDVGAATPPVGSVTVRNVIDFLNQGNSQATYVLSPAGTLNNTSGSNYQPLISLRLSPSVSEGLTGSLGDRDVINRMQLRLNQVGVQTNQLIDVKILLNGRLNNLNFQPVDSPSLVQVIEHTSNDTISGGIQVYNFKANGQNGTEQTTSVDISELFELSNSILGGNSVFPDGPDILTIAVARLTGQSTLASANLSWAEAQA